MTKAEAVNHYKAAVSVFSKWLAEGFISEEEFAIIDTKTASKYGLSSCSIYRRNDLINKGFRANIERGKEV
jgi:hypothetical protein